MRRNREASIIVLVSIVIAVLHRRITVESVVDVRGHKSHGWTEKESANGSKFLTIGAAEEL